MSNYKGYTTQRTNFVQRATRNTQKGFFFCRYCKTDIYYNAVYNTVWELRKYKVLHYGQVHRKDRKPNWRAHECDKCDATFSARHELKDHKYEKHGY